MNSRHIPAAIVILLFASSECFALWQSTPVSKKRAAEMGMKIRCQSAGDDFVKVELEFRPQGKLKGHGLVELRIGKGDRSIMTVPLREVRNQQDAVVVEFTASRDQLNKLTFAVLVPFPRGGDEYLLRVKKFIEQEESENSQQNAQSR